MRNRRRGNTEYGTSMAQVFGDLRADYDAARPSIYRRSRPGVSSTGSNADYHYRSTAHYYGMMELAWDLYRNHMLVGQGVRRLVANVIQDGYTPDPKTGDEGADDLLEARWREWSADRRQVDVEQQKTFHDLEAAALLHVIVGGDILGLPLRDGPLQMIEGHRIKTPTNSRKNIIHGVEVDNLRRRLGYYVAKEDVGITASVKRVADTSYYDALDSSGEPAAFHLYRPDRLSQTRGVTALAPPADNAGMGDDLMFAMLVKAQSAACWAILHEFSDTAGVPMPGTAGQHGEQTTEDRPDGSVRRIEGAAPGMEVFGYKGEKISGFSPNIPNAEFFDHARLILTVIAVNLDMPLMMFLLDPTATNFSGWRGAMDQAKIRFRDFQRWLVDHFHREVWRWKVRQWIADDSALQRLAENPKVNLLAHQWRCPGWPYIQPLQDVSADVLEERTAQNSPRRIQAKNGRDFWEVADETISDNAYRIRAAKKEAATINGEFPQDKLPCTWRDLISMPAPEGISISTQPPPEPAAEESSQPKPGARA